MLMLCLEWWMFEIGGFLSGVISETELAAQSIIYQMAVIAYMVQSKANPLHRNTLPGPPLVWCM